MKKLALAALTITTAQAQLVSLSGGETFIGDEYFQNKKTGNTCVVQIQEMHEAETKGLHCSKVSSKMFFHGKEKDLYLGENVLYSRITNYHSAEYPAVKTCAELVKDENGNFMQADIYGEDTTYLFNRILSGEVKVKGVQYHSFLSFNSTTKELERARIHRLSWFTEKTWDCLNLKRQ